MSRKFIPTSEENPRWIQGCWPSLNTEARASDPRWSNSRAPASEHRSWANGSTIRCDWSNQSSPEPIRSMVISGSNRRRYGSTIYKAIFCEDIPWKLGLSDRPSTYARYLQSIGFWNGHWFKYPVRWRFEASSKALATKSLPVPRGPTSTTFGWSW